MDSQRCVLKNKKGQYVTVRKLKEELKLCAVDQQDSKKAPSVQLWKNKDKQLAFKFHRSDGCYCLKVVGEDLKLDQIDMPTNLTKNHWFEECNIHSGEHHGLQSVVEPKHYLSIKAENQRNILALSPNSEDCVQIRYDKSDEKTCTCTCTCSPSSSSS